MRDVVYANQKSIGYAEIYVADSAVAQSIPTGATYTKVTLFTTNGLSKRCTADVANDKLIATKNGIYFVNGSFNMQSGTALVTFRGAAFLGGNEQNQIHWKRIMSVKSDSGSASFTGFINVTTAPQDIDFRVRHDNGGNVDFTLEYANMNIQFVE